MLSVCGEVSVSPNFSVPDVTRGARWSPSLGFTKSVDSSHHYSFVFDVQSDVDFSANVISDEDSEERQIICREVFACVRRLLDSFCLHFDFK